MSAHKILIIGIDCLDYYLVKKWKLQALQLTSTGYYLVKSDDRYTPILWLTLLSGIDVTKYGYTSQRISRSKRLKNFISVFLSLLNKDLFSYLKYEEGNIVERIRKLYFNYIKKILIKALIFGNKSLSFKEKISYYLFLKSLSTEKAPKKILKKTPLYLAYKKNLKVLSIEFPPLNDNIYRIIRNTLYFLIDAPESLRRYILEKIYKGTEVSLKLILNKIKNYDIILWYTPYIDILSHMYYKPRNLKGLLRLYIGYSKINKLIGKFLSKIKDNNLAIIIMSDHGYDPLLMDHSYYGYWSTNIKINNIKTHQDLSYFIGNKIFKIIKSKNEKE